MKSENSPKRIYGPSYFSNWSDQFTGPLANKLLPLALKIPGISPNAVSFAGFAVFLAGIISLFASYPYHLLVSAVILPFAYILDCLDGQVARTIGKSSAFGSYLDKTIDYFKVFAITAALSYALYIQTGSVTYIWLGYIASFFFTFRYYIKYIAIFSEVSKDKLYLDRCREVSEKAYVTIENDRKEKSKTVTGKIQVLWNANKSIFEVEEAELIMFTAVGALFNRLDIVLWVLAISQILIVIVRLATRGYQVEHDTEALLQPMKK